MPPRRPGHRAEIGPSTPLREVRLGNFKSVRGAAVELRPLTAIVGRNSSGKSTLLQGILALSQAVRREVVTQTFPLNGDLVRLGTFDEVRNFDAAQDAGIDIGFTAEIAHRVPGPLRAPDRGTIGTVSWEAHLVAPPEDLGSGQAQLDTIEFVVNSATGDTSVANVALTVSKILGATSRQSRQTDRVLPFFVRDGAEFEIDGRITDMQSGQSSTVHVMTVSGGLPVRVFRYDKRFNVRFRLWWDLAFEQLDGERQRARRDTAEGLENDNTRARTEKKVRDDSEWAIAFAQKCLTSEEIPDRDTPAFRRLFRMGRMAMHGADLARFDSQISGLEETERLAIANSMNGLGERTFKERLRDALVEANVDWLDEQVRDEPTTDLHGVLEQATFETHSLFRDVRYLGPLRAKPQVMYSPGIGQDDLGPEGEFAAAYLHTHGSRHVVVPLPDGGFREMPLGEGLNLWLEELGLADRAAAKDRGRLGIGLYVQPVGRAQSVDLTSVGVGVSQALPVILLCLLATPRSVVLIEQPELHLHPAMQLKLADFLLACSRTGRQIVIETHSEHVINRLRLRVAADESSETANIVRLLFAEQDKGETRYRVSDINEVGGLDADWPKGFLDVAADESTRLLQQSLAKKRAQTDTNR
jgi:hypothetical protein